MVAFVWHLARDWNDVWGGQLVWSPSGAAVYPRFNALSIFNVSDASVHCVAAVSQRALGKRFGINGWWHCEAPAVELGPPPPESAGPRPHVTTSYGPPVLRIGGEDGVIIV